MNITDYGPLKETKSHFDSDFLYNTYLCSIPVSYTHLDVYKRQVISPFTIALAKFCAGAQ